MVTNSARQTIKRLYQIRNQYGAEAMREKLALLDRIPRLSIRAATDLRRLHLTLCFMRAFPDAAPVHAQAVALLEAFATLVGGLGDAQRSRMADSGIAGTDVHYNFSYEVAAWMAQRFPGIAAIDWDAEFDTARLDELLEKLLQHAETDYFDSGRASTEDWVGLSAEHQRGSDFDWLMSEIADRPRDACYWTALYNAADLPLCCELGDSRISRTRNVYPVDTIYFRHDTMRSRVRRPKPEIAKPVRTICRLGKRDGTRLIDVAMSSLAVRHRETIHFNHANPDEVYLAYVGKGVVIAVTGLRSAQRYPLECTMGFLILSNGVPIGYGGSSIFFRQANTGINIFEEYRGSEAAWLWVQVMRVFHTLARCTRFIANPYQFGSENSEALKSGAFWFYYRLGYRPVDAAVRELAASEYARLCDARGYHTPLAVLRRLATCDMHLTLPGARQSEFFDESWLDTLSLLATRQLALTGQPSRRKAVNTLERRLVAELGIPDPGNWDREERRWLRRLCPIVAATDPGRWSRGDRKALVALMRAKGGRCELDFVKLFRKHAAFFAALKRACRRADAAA